MTGLYTPVDRALVRAPLFAASTGRSLLAQASDGSLLPGDPRVRAAVAVASADLTAALARTTPGDRKAERLRGKLRRYLIRMSTRPTPYGLFAGVGLVGWSGETDLSIEPESPRTRTRPDMEWLLGLVADLERDPAIRAGLRLVASSAVVLRGGRAFLRDGADSAVSVRATNAVRRALDLARTPIPWSALVQQLADLPGADREKAERLAEQLWQQGFLFLDLRPPLTAGDPARHVQRQLAAIPAARATADGLAGLLEALAAWDRQDLDERADSWPGLLTLARTLHLDGEASHLLQTDMALPLAGARIHDAVGAEAARAAELMLRLSPSPRGLPHLAAYRHAFEARYGVERDVPLLELLDPDFGLGPPESHHPHAADLSSAPQRERLLRELALDAYRERKLVVELDDEMLSRLETWRPDADSAPPSLDVSVFLAARSPAAIDAGEFQVVVGPNLGAGAAGRNLGRFADLLGRPAQELLDLIAKAQTESAPDRVLAEIVYLPPRPRSANVTVRRTGHAREIPISTLPGVPYDQVVPLDELVVGVRDDGRFTVRWPARDAEVVGLQGHMLNPQHAPAAARFLLDVAADQRCLISGFHWGGAASFPFLPRVQHGRVVLCLARWLIDPSALDPEPAGGFAASLRGWRERWRVPRQVYLSVGDNRLLLDLDDPHDVDILREDLRGAPQGHSVQIHEALPGPEHAWLPGPGGGHIAELVVPVTVREPAPRTAPTGPSPLAVRPAADRTRLRTPGSDWLYLKLYTSPVFEDELICGPLRSFGEFATNAGLSDRWFFLRYADPQPHLRVRFHGEPTVLLGQLMRQICEWAADLVADGVCTGFSFDTYERELERYGGEAGTRAAELIFAADSPAVAGMLALSRQDSLKYDLTSLAVRSCDDLLDSLGIDPAQRTVVYGTLVAPSPQAGKEYRVRKRELRQLLGDTSTGEEPALAALLAARRVAIAPAAALLTSLQRDARLHRPLADLCRSYLHLHANRLLGRNPAQEQLVMQLLKRTRDSLRHAPVA